MKSDKKDPYNFDKTEEFIREYNLKTNGKKPSGGKIYMKRPRFEGQGKSAHDGLNK